MPKRNEKFIPISRERFEEAWRNLRIHNLRFSRTITDDKKTHNFPNEGISVFKDIARLTRRELLSMNGDARLRARFCAAAGIKDSDFKRGLAVTKNPAEYAYLIMRGYNTGQRRPCISFTMGKDHVRYYVAGPR